ncbi:MAG: ABC transporter substrate-binding protein [Anaerolineales bacterium]|nr:ABC transporter substrate-binding protein [Anaerolineales bacterium]
MSRKLWALLLVLALVATLFAACKPAAPAIPYGGELKVGVNAEITGAIPTVGEACVAGAEIARDEINGAGGVEIGGKKYTIKLFIEDNENKPESAAAAARKLVSQDNVLVHIGANASKNAIPAGGVCNELETPMISPWSTNPYTTLRRPWVFRVPFIDSFQAGVNAWFGMNEFKAKKGAVLFDIGSDACYFQGHFFKRVWEGIGGEMVAFTTFTTGDKDFTAQLTKIKESGAEVLYVPQYYDEVPLIVKQANRLGLTPKGGGTIRIIGHDGWESPDLLKLCGDDCDGLFFTTHWALDIAGEKTQAFIKKFREKVGKDPESTGGLTYDAVYLFVQALKNCGELTGDLAKDRKCIRDGLAALKSYEGVTGTMTPTSEGDMIKSVHIVQIDAAGNRFKWYTTVDPAAYEATLSEHGLSVEELMQ